VLVTDPKELEKIREREQDITKERIQRILAAGANVVLTTKGIDDMALKYFVEAGAIACRRVPKEDLRCARVRGARAGRSSGGVPGAAGACARRSVCRKRAPGRAHKTPGCQRGWSSQAAASWQVTAD